jgi:hypothetical protein
VRRPAALVLAFLGLLIGLVSWSPPSATAQDEPAVRLALLSQTPWNSLDSYENGFGRDLVVRFRAENLGDAPIDRLSVGVTLYGRLISRTAFEDSLSTDTGFTIDAETLRRDGTLEPGQPRDFEIAFRLDSLGISSESSGVYPLKIDLRSGFTSLAALRTPVIFLVREPELPLSLSWTFVLHQQIAFDPQGVFTSTSMESSLQPGGVLSSQIRALTELVGRERSPAVDVAMSAMLLSQLTRMRDGYRHLVDGVVSDVAAGDGASAAAAEALASLRTITRATNVRVSALPYALPEFPALVDGGLARDVTLQLQRGDETVRTTLGATPTTGVLRPPGAALDDDTLRELEAAGVTTVVVGPSTVLAGGEDPLGFAPAPTAALDGGALDAVVPDIAVMTLLGSELVRDDPVLGAHALLAELASIWQEQPGVERGVALVLSEDLAAPGAFYPPFVDEIASAPWLHPMHAAEFVAAFPPAEASPLTAPAARRFAPEYISQLRQARRRIQILRSMLIEPSDEPDRFDTMLLIAESRQFLANPAEGLAFITAVRDSVGAVLGGITVERPDVITLTSSTGSSVPITVGNTTDHALRVGVQLVSQHLRNQPSTELELGPGESELVTFPVELRSTGRFQVLLRVIAPGGRPLAETEFTVRSTVYNRIALYITLGAALVLVGMWARRLWPRRTR